MPGNTLNDETQGRFSCRPLSLLILQPFKLPLNVIRRDLGKMDWNMVWQIALLIIGFVMLIKGADWFVDGAAGIADKLHIPQLIIGLTIVAMGTSAPEAAISISASVQGSADIAVGNILGSNILNILIILGITSVITPLAVQKSTVKYEIPFVIIISVIFGLIGLFDNSISLRAISELGILIPTVLRLSLIHISEPTRP